MNYQPKSIRTFIGAKNYSHSRAFYTSYFKVNDQLGFYLQDYYVKKWIDNSMVFLEVDDLEVCEAELLSKNLQTTYKYVRFSEIKEFDWGRELFMHDPSGVLWHFGEFKND